MLRQAVRELRASARPRVKLDWDRSPRTGRCNQAQARCASGVGSSSSAPRLPAPSVSWSWSEEDLIEAEKEVRHRKAAFNLDHLQELRSLRANAKALQEKLAAATARQKAIGSRIRELQIEAKKQGDKADDSALAAAQQDAATAKLEARAAADEQDRLHSRSLELRLQLPNRTHSQIPKGAEPQARIIGLGGPTNIAPSIQVGQVIANDQDHPREAKYDHLHIAEAAQGAFGGIDLRSGVVSTGSSWPYLIGTLALLEHALAQFALAVALKRDYLVVSPPEVVKTDLAARCGFNPRDENASQTYFVATDAGKSQDATEELCLVGTAEISIAAMLAGRMFPAAGPDGEVTSTGSAALNQHPLPLRLVALSNAFRAEAGARGADTRGLYRVHQFSKAELFIVCTAAQSEEMLEELRAIQEEIATLLGLPYRVLDMPSEELGASAYRKYDMEAWMPGRGSWGEISSASNCTDHQSRRLHIKHKTRRADGKSDFVHTLNGTAVAVPRIIVALLENYAITQDHRLRLPECLKPFWLKGEADTSVEWFAPQASKRVAPASSATPGSSGRRAYSTRSTRPSAVQGALARVRALAERTGTDPASLVVAFLLLHELTAAVPLLALFYLFTTFGLGAIILQWLLPDSVHAKNGSDEAQVESKSDSHSAEGSWLTLWIKGKLEEGMRRAERYGRRKGYFGFEKQEAGEIDTTAVGATVLAGAFADAVAAYVVVKVRFLRSHMNDSADVLHLLSCCCPRESLRR